MNIISQYSEDHRHFDFYNRIQSSFYPTENKETSWEDIKRKIRVARLSRPIVNWNLFEYNRNIFKIYLKR